MLKGTKPKLAPSEHPAKITEPDRLMLDRARQTLVAAQTAQKRAEIVAITAHLDQRDILDGMEKKYSLKNGDGIDTSTGVIQRKA